MEYKAEIMGLELEVCPITKQVFRHPVLASDGYHYELIALYERELISPLTGEPITSLVYDLFLYAEIENLSYENRYQDYNKDKILSKLTISDSRYQSNLLALVFLLIIARQSTTSPFCILSILLITGLADYGIRLCSNHQFGFFGVVKRVWNVLKRIEPEQLPCGPGGAYLD